jgi:hypothetical protein
MANVNGLLLDDEFVRRMRNWARRGAGNDYGALRASAFDYGAGPAGGVRQYREAAMPFLSGEADDTERALQRVPIAQQMAVRRFWSREGDSWVALGVALGVTDKTARQWVERGHEAVKAELYRMAAIYRAAAEINRQRALAEAAQKAA